MVLFYELRLKSRHIPGHLNVKADRLSQCSQVISSEWSFHPIWQKWGKPHIDLFAKRNNKKIPMFVSPFPDERAWAVDALAITCMIGNVGICLPSVSAHSNSPKEIKG